MHKELEQASGAKQTPDPRCQDENKRQGRLIE